MRFTLVFFSLGNEFMGESIFSRIINNQWLDFFYCDAIPSDVIMLRGPKKMHTQNRRTSLSERNIISDGSVIVVNEGQAAITVENGKIADIFTNPGEYEFHSRLSESVFSGGGGSAIATEVERELTGGKQVDQRVYYVNMREMCGNPFSCMGALPVRFFNEELGLDMDVSVRYGGRYSIRVDNPEKLYRFVTGNIHDRYYLTSLTSQISTELLMLTNTAVAQITEEGVRPSELSGILPEISERVYKNVREGVFQDRGLVLVSAEFDYIYVVEETASEIRQVSIAGALMADMEKRNPLLPDESNANPLLSNSQKTNPLLPDSNKKNPFL